MFCYIAYIWQSWCIFQWCDYWPTSGCELSDVPASWNCSVWHFCSSLLRATAWHRRQGCSVAPAAAAGKHCTKCSAAAAQDISCQSWPVRQRRWWWHCWCWAQPLVWYSVRTSQARTTSKSVFVSWFSLTVCMQHLLGLKHLFVYNTALLTQFLKMQFTYAQFKFLAPVILYCCHILSTMHTASVGLLAVWHSHNSLSLLLCCFYWTPILLNHAVTAHQIYTRDLTVGWTPYSLMAFLLNYPLIFMVVKKCEIWPRFSTPLVFELPSFQNEGTCWYQSTKLG